MTEITQPIFLTERLKERISLARNTLGMSQQDLAEAAGVPQSQISKLERGAIDEPALSTIVNIANALGVSADDLTSQSQEALLKKITNKAVHVKEASPQTNKKIEKFITELLEEFPPAPSSFLTNPLESSSDRTPEQEFKILIERLQDAKLDINSVVDEKILSGLNPQEQSFLSSQYRTFFHMGMFTFLRINKYIPGETKYGLDEILLLAENKDFYNKIVNNVLENPEILEENKLNKDYPDFPSWSSWNSYDENNNLYRFRLKAIKVYLNRLNKLPDNFFNKTGFGFITGSGKAEIIDSSLVRKQVIINGGPKSGKTRLIREMVKQEIKRILENSKDTSLNYVPRRIVLFSPQAKNWLQELNSSLTKEISQVPKDFQFSLTYQDLNTFSYNFLNQNLLTETCDSALAQSQILTEALQPLLKDYQLSFSELYVLKAILVAIQFRNQHSVEPDWTINDIPGLLNENKLTLENLDSVNPGKVPAIVVNALNSENKKENKLRGTFEKINRLFRHISSNQNNSEQWFSVSKDNLDEQEYMPSKNKLEVIAVEINSNSKLGNNLLTQLALASTLNIHPGDSSSVLLGALNIFIDSPDISANKIQSIREEINISGGFEAEPGYDSYSYICATDTVEDESVARLKDSFKIINL